MMAPKTGNHIHTPTDPIKKANALRENLTRPTSLCRRGLNRRADV